jgi:hypothetical protein
VSWCLGGRKKQWPQRREGTKQHKEKPTNKNLVNLSVLVPWWHKEYNNHKVSNTLRSKNI